MDSSVANALLSPFSLALLGLCVGSFLNVVIHRLPIMLERGWKQESADLLGVKFDADQEAVSLSRPRSRCPHCKHFIRWYENIPVLSYRRPQRSVRFLRSLDLAKISLGRSPHGVAFRPYWMALRSHADGACSGVPLRPVLVALAGIDWDTTILPDNMTLPLLWAGLVASALGWTIDLPQALWGAVAGYLSLWSIYWIFKLVTGKEGMGFGDFKLLAATGAWLGVKMLLPIVLAASLIGAVVGIVMKMSAALREGRYVPFGPFLAGAH
jgi:leader peptidase (prepilin peptidase)/N-methyltransferase